MRRTSYMCVVLFVRWFDGVRVCVSCSIENICVCNNSFATKPHCALKKTAMIYESIAALTRDAMLLVCLQTFSACFVNMWFRFGAHHTPSSQFSHTYAAAKPSGVWCVYDDIVYRGYMYIIRGDCLCDFINICKIIKQPQRRRQRIATTTHTQRKLGERRRRVFTLENPIAN